MIRQDKSNNQLIITKTELAQFNRAFENIGRRLNALEGVGQQTIRLGKRIRQVSQNAVEDDDLMRLGDPNIHARLHLLDSTPDHTGIDGNVNEVMVLNFDGLPKSSDIAISDLAILAGQPSGQILYGGTEAGDDLILRSTSHATKGNVHLGTLSTYDEANDRIGIGTLSPLTDLHVSDGNAPDAALISTDYILLSYQGVAPGQSIVAASSAHAAHRGVYKGVRARGTLSTPMIAVDGDYILSILAGIFDGTDVEATGAIDFIADGAVANNVAPIKISFVTSETTGGARTEKMVIKASGNVGIGQATPTAILHLKAGTAAAGTAPVKLAAGTNLTTPEAGALEWDGTNLFVTQTVGPTRKTIAYDGDYLKLDQTTPQTVINGMPQFDEGLGIKQGKRIYLDET